MFKYSWKKIILLILIIILTGVFFCRAYLSDWAVRQYFKSKGVGIEFELNRFSLSEISLSSVLLDGKVAIEEINVGLSGSVFDVSELQSLSFKMKTLSVKDFKVVFNKLLGTGESEERLGYESFDSFCKTARPMSLDVQINEFLVKGKKTSLGLRIKKEKEASNIQLNIEGHLEDSPLDILTFSKLDYLVNSEVFCKEDRVDIEAEVIKLKMNSFTFKDKPYFVKKLDLDIKKAHVEVKKDESLKIKLPGNIDVDIEKGKNPYLQVLALYC